MIGLMCQRELILVKLMVHESVLFVITDIFFIYILDFSQKYATVAVI